MDGDCSAGGRGGRQAAAVKLSVETTKQRADRSEAQRSPPHQGQFGACQASLGDASVYNQIPKSTLTWFDMRRGRRDGNCETLLFDFRAMKLSSGSPAISGKNQDVMIDAGFQATMHATLGYTMLVQRFYYLPTS